MVFRIPKFLQPRTLQQRNMLFLILPTLVVLLIMGASSLFLVRKALLSQWEQTAIAKMQAAAHEVDMRLLRPKRLLMLFQEQAGEKFNRNISQFLLDQLKNVEGVVKVDMVWNDEAGNLGSGFEVNSSQMGHMGSRVFRKMKPLEVTTPAYDMDFKGQTVSLVSEFKDADDRNIGHIEVKISFFDLVDTMVKTSWWQSNRAYLVDQRGNVLTRTSSRVQGVPQTVADSFGVANEMEKKTLAALQEKEFGTIFGAGMPPVEVSSFYRLREAPWTMVVIKPGRVVFQQLLQFRNYYFTTIGLGIIIALLLIRVASSGTARAIRGVSAAARELARGNFGKPLIEDRLDEVGELTRNFNIMTQHLQERLLLQQAMTVAREVQQNLLPQSSYRVDGLDVSGCTIYSEETGGDYFDLLPDRRNSRRFSVVIGDVVGHGIGAALLMASIRAIVRCRTSLPGSPVEVIDDVNAILCRDTEQSGAFVSLFYLVIDSVSRELHWVRCGHDPAIVYDMETHQFSEMHGEGLVLGFDADWQFKENSMDIDGRRLAIVLGSDGVWETENSEGESFGKERVRNILAENSHRSSEEIISAITEAVNVFRGSLNQVDDVTLVVVKTDDGLLAQ